MRGERRYTAEIGSHPFRSLFDLMVALVFLLLAALALSHPKQDARHATGYEKERQSLLRDQLLMLHNLEQRRKDPSGRIRLYTDLSQLPASDECHPLAEAIRDHTFLSDEQIAELEAHRDRKWQEMASTIRDRLLAPTVTLNYGQDLLHFPTGSDAPDNQSGLPRILNDVAARCRQGYRRIRVEGHTDNIPIWTPHFHSNWELSAARAIWLTEKIEADLKARSVPLGRSGVLVEAIGYGDRNPKTDNLTAAHRRLNRRIEIVFEK